MEARSDGGSGGGIGFAGSSSSSRFISQIFWPEHCLNLGGRRGYLIGWNTAAFKCLVVTLVTVDAETGLPTLDQTERALELLSADPRCRTLNDFCSSDGAPPTVLGEWLPNGHSRPQQGGGGGGTSGSGAGYDSYHDDGAGSAAAAAAARRQSANIWLTVGQSRGRPVLRSLYCCGCAYRTCCYVVLYRPCNPDVLEYLPTVKKNASSGDEDGDGGDGDEDDNASVAAADNNNNAHGENGSPLSRAADDAAEPPLSSASPTAGASGARDEDGHGVAAGVGGGDREVNVGVNR
ncbi:hypothetical protein Esi_0184_0042 [Ectocarpus siliculosus]|uniref:Uncharacterized protein n=1 Tax=Ectocarpus siliculosus TaxID=2880 RepID=D7FP24_ECTSI|nr:hypothetical protein Esi_0184_0042 [Ectocarpus siliculosus]|eukprot:CBJ30291.1 hypothetical protein Esi_0184_0042 [Ectocarpus siliculosus]